jgi:hypothetical protein
LIRIGAERGGEKRAIHIIKPSFCAEGLWPEGVSGDYFVNLIFYALRQSEFLSTGGRRLGGEMFFSESRVVVIGGTPLI